MVILIPDPRYVMDVLAALMRELVDDAPLLVPTMLIVAAALGVASLVGVLVAVR